MAVTIDVAVEGRAIKVTVLGAADASPEVSRRSPYGSGAVRLSAQVDVPGVLVAYDYEAPLDVELQYTVEGASSAKIVMPSNGLDWWVSLATPTLTRSVWVESFPALTRPLGHALVQPQRAKNPVPVIQRRRGATGTLTLLSLTLEEGSAIRNLIENSPLLMFIGPPSHGFGQGIYLLARDYDEVRAFADARQPERRFVIDVQEVDRPPVVIEQAPINSWQDWADSGRTWGDWRDTDYLHVLTDTGMTA